MIKKLNDDAFCHNRCFKKKKTINQIQKFGVYQQNHI